MNAPHGPSETVDPGELIAYLHDELEPDERTELLGHLEGCAECRSLLETLDHRMRRLTDTLAASDFAVPAEPEWREILEAVRGTPRFRRSQARFRVAAGVLLAVMGAALLTSSPVRAWIGERWSELVGTPAASAAPDPARGDQPAGVGSATLSFHPDGAAIEAVVESAQAGGELSVRFTDHEAARIAVTDGGTERLTVGRGGIRIANTVGSTASYTLSLPAGVERITVRVGSAPPHELSRWEPGVVRVDLVTGRVRDPGDRNEG